MDPEALSITCALPNCGGSSGTCRFLVLVAAGTQDLLVGGRNLSWGRSLSGSLQRAEELQIR